MEVKSEEKEATEILFFLSITIILIIENYKGGSRCIVWEKNERIR